MPGIAIVLIIGIVLFFVISFFVEDYKKNQELKKRKEEWDTQVRDCLAKQDYINKFFERNESMANSDKFKSFTSEIYSVRSIKEPYPNLVNPLYEKVKECELRIVADEQTRKLKIAENEKQRITASRVGKLIDKSIQKLDAFTRPNAGVYLIVNNKTLDFYIGESQDMTFRRKIHFVDLSDNNHHSKLMQKYYNRHGKDVFDFYILEVNRMDDENTRKYAEERWIKDYSPPYNTNK